MKDLFLKAEKRLKRFLDLEIWRGRFEGAKRTQKRNILIAIVLVLCMRLFFYAYFDHFARAEQIAAIGEINPEIIDPMIKIKKDSLEKEEKILPKKLCQETDIKELPVKKNKKENGDYQKYLNLVKDYPMEEMVPYIVKRDKKTASFLVAIAKKESDWGKHSPSKNGKHCYNYWGYKGGYNLTHSGYSCFDSAEQAVEVVGDRIENLIEKKIDTPQKMLVWKCGSACAGDGGAASWVGAVSGYFYELVS